MVPAPAAVAQRTRTARADAPRPVSAGALAAAATAAGLIALGATGASPFEDTRRDLIERRAAGFSGSMQFTFRNPDRATDPGRILPGARSLVVGALSYPHPAPGSTAQAVDRQGRPRGRVGSVAASDVYGDLRRALGEIRTVLLAAGWRAVVVADENSLVDRAAAHRAGLGWFGRNSLLLVRGAGSWCVLGSVVTDALIPPGPIVVPGAGRRRQVPLPEPHAAGCGRCARCIDACPTGALVAPGVLDARRCLAWVLQAPGPIPEALRPATGDRLYGCDDCQTTCPVNLTADRHRGGRPFADPAAVDLVGLLEATDGELLDRFGRWYLPGRDPTVLRRNALVALGNVGVDSPAVRTVLARYGAGEDATLAEHAMWAVTRLDQCAGPAVSGGHPG